MNIIKSKIQLYHYFLLLFIFYLFYRTPIIFFNGRFFAEGGSQWWSYARANDFIETIFYSPAGGYFCLSCNLQVAISDLFNISYAPLVSVWISFFFYLLPSLLFFTISKNYVTNLNRNLLSILILILPSLNFLEIFLNLLSTPIFLSVTTFIILIYGSQEVSVKFSIFRNIIIFLSLFSTLYSIFLLPGVVLLWLRDKKNKLYSFTIITGIFASFLHLNVFFYSYFNGALAFRSLNSNLSIISVFEFLRTGITYILLGEAFHQIETYKNFAFIVFLLIILLNLKKINLNNIVFYLLVLTFQFVLIFYGSAGGNFYGRYASVISTIIFLFVLNFLQTNSKYFKYYFIPFLLIYTSNFHLQGGQYFIECTEYCIVWEEQVYNVETGIQTNYIHWPIGKGDPYWFTDGKNPVPSPSPFLIKKLGGNNPDFFNIGLNDIVNFNFEFIKNYFFSSSKKL